MVILSKHTVFPQIELILEAGNSKPKIPLALLHQYRKWAIVSKEAGRIFIGRPKKAIEFKTLKLDLTCCEPFRLGEREKIAQNTSCDILKSISIYHDALIKLFVYVRLSPFACDAEHSFRLTKDDAVTLKQEVHRKIPIFISHKSFS